MADTNYDGIFGTGFSFTFTPTTGTPFGSTQAQVEEANTPPNTIDTAKYTPISGSNSGIEQFAMGRYPVQEYKIKVTYAQAEHAAAMTCLQAKVKGVLVCNYGDGSVDTFSGAGLTSVLAGPNTATGLRTAEITITCPVPPTFTSGTANTVVQSSQILTAGAATIDFTASPYSGGTMVLADLFLMNTGAADMTVAKGATNGYTGFGSSFSVTIKPGQSVHLNSTVALSPTVKTLDISGTGSQVLVVQAQMH